MAHGSLLRQIHTRDRRPCYHMPPMSPIDDGTDSLMKVSPSAFSDRPCFSSLQCFWSLFSHRPRPTGFIAICSGAEHAPKGPRVFMDLPKEGSGALGQLLDLSMGMSS